MGVGDRRTSHAAVDGVLEFERKLVEGWEGDLVVREQRGRVMQLQRVPEWCDAYHGALDGMVEHGGGATPSMAWLDLLDHEGQVEAGQPDLATALQPEPKGLLRWWRRLKPSR